MIFILWYLSGLFVNLIQVYQYYRQGSDLLLEDLFTILILSLTGPFMFLVFLKYLPEMNYKSVVLRGKRK